MKKMIIATLLLSMMHIAHGMEFADGMVKATLLDHVSYTGQIVDGETRGAFVDSIILVGSHNGRSIFDVQAGFAGDTKPRSADEEGIKWIAGGFFKVSSLLRDRLKLADHWKFLNSLEYGVKYDYDFTDKRDYVSLQVGLAFTLQPKQ